MQALVTGVSAAGGLLLGGELEILVDRTGARAGFERPWWRCGSCGHPQHGWGVLPLTRPWVWRAGCPSCGTVPSQTWRPLATAVVSALVLGGFAARIGADAALVPFAFFGLALVAISAVDLERQIIPNRLVYPTLGVLIVLLVMASAVDDRWHSLAMAAISGAVAFGAFFTVHFIVPRGMGFGDVRLAGVIGLGTGWLGYGQAVVGFFAAFFLGALIGVLAMALTDAGRKTRIPFGPFLAAGAVVTVLWGGPVAHTLFHRAT